MWIALLVKKTSWVIFSKWCKSKFSWKIENNLKMLFEKSFNHFSIHIYNNKQYHQKLKHSCNFDKKQNEIKCFCQLRLSFWWYCSLLNFMSEMIFSNIYNRFNILKWRSYKCNPLSQEKVKKNFKSSQWTVWSV